MASPRLRAAPISPIRGISCQLSRIRLSHDRVPTSQSASLRSITTSASPRASVSSITVSEAAPYVPSVPFAQQTVQATIYSFPSLEPLGLQSYPAAYLNLPTRRDILHRAIVYEGDMTRSGTASTKWRSEVNGSAHKIRPQKGSGRARLGDRKSPMLRGGGVAHGPRPRDFSTELPRKVYDLAWRTALSYRFRKGQLLIVDNPLELEGPDTRLLEAVWKSHGWWSGQDKPHLITTEERPLLSQTIGRLTHTWNEKGRRGGNFWGRLRTWEEVDVKDLLEGGKLVIERQALNRILRNHQSDLHSIPEISSIISWSRTNDSPLGWHHFRDLVLTPQAEAHEATINAFVDVSQELRQNAAKYENEASKSVTETAMSDTDVARTPQAQEDMNNPDWLRFRAATLLDESRRLLAIKDKQPLRRKVQQELAKLKADRKKSSVVSKSDRGEQERRTQEQAKEITKRINDLESQKAALEKGEMADLSSIGINEEHLELAEISISGQLAQANAIFAKLRRNAKEERQYLSEAAASRYEYLTKKASYAPEDSPERKLAEADVLAFEIEDLFDAIPLNQDDVVVAELNREIDLKAAKEDALRKEAKAMSSS